MCEKISGYESKVEHHKKLLLRNGLNLMQIRPCPAPSGNLSKKGLPISFSFEKSKVSIVLDTHIPKSLVTYIDFQTKMVS